MMCARRAGWGVTLADLAWVVGLAAGLALLLFLAACEKKTAYTPPPPPKVTVAQSVRQGVTDYLELTGNTQAVNTVQLVARVDGYLEKVLFKDGQLVKKGQLLFLIQQDTYRDRILQAEGQVAAQQAQMDYSRLQETRYANLVQKRAAARTDLDNWRYQQNAAQANLKAAQASLNLAKLDLSYTRVTAPFDGRIDRRQKDPGNLVGPSSSALLAEINQIDPLYVYFTISETDLLRVTGKAGWTPARLNAKSWPAFMGLANDCGCPHEGRLDFAAITLTPTTGTLLLRGVFPNRDGKILPGLYARIRLPVEKKEAWLLPETALGYDQLGPYLLLVNEENKVERRNVKTGMQVETFRVIAEGLSGNEWVVVKGTQRAIVGRKVTPEKETLTPPPPPCPPPPNSSTRARP
jgi:RND family efflux transporter MFP subunit